MPPSLFISYCHIDEPLRNQLEVHLAALKRQGVISIWHDRRIIAGSHLGSSIDASLNVAEVILLLVSPDFIASDYCYNQEMKRAMERHHNGEARVIPVILRPCDWHDLPFGELLATPRDGKAITIWPNIDEAYLDVVRSIKTALKSLEAKGSTAAAKDIQVPIASPAWSYAVTDTLSGPRSSNLRVKKEFTELDRDRFRQQGFEFIARFFENSMMELVDRNPALLLEQRFQRIDAAHFTAAIYKAGQKVCKGSASMDSGAMSRNSIEYAMNDSPRSGSMNEAVSVQADDQMLYFQALGMQSMGTRDNQKLSAQGAAELFWGLFIRPLQ